MWRNYWFWFTTTKVYFSLLLLVIYDKNYLVWRHLKSVAISFLGQLDFLHTVGIVNLCLSWRNWPQRDLPPLASVVYYFTYNNNVVTSGVTGTSKVLYSPGANISSVVLQQVYKSRTCFFKIGLGIFDSFELSFFWTLVLLNSRSFELFDLFIL